MHAELTHDADGPAGFPDDGLPEVAVLGRSNVGKSTFINALVGRRRLARTSGTPGKTRRIHFYRLEQTCYLVDLPGFGFAAVQKREQRSWRPMVESYLRGSRAPLVGALLLVDARRGPEAEEADLLEWLASEEIETRIVLTKADKLKPAPLRRSVEEIAGGLGLRPDDVAAVSGKTGRGLARVGTWMRGWTGLSITRPDGSRLLG